MARRQIGSVLVATDLGDDSEQLVATAATLASRAGADLHLLHSLELPFTPPEDAMRRTGFFGNIEAAEARLQEQAGRLAASGVTPASQEVVIYIAHKAILDRAAEVAADMIVLGPHRGFRRPRFLGTTADHVARSANVPCLVVGGPAAFPVGRIGVLTDFSETARQALQTALAWIHVLARGEEDGTTDTREVQLVHVAHPLLLAVDTDLGATIERQLDELIAQATAEADAHPVTVDPEVLWDENYVEAVERWVANEEIGMIALGTHGGGAVERALIGSMAYTMARLTPCPVLLVPTAARPGGYAR
jgi:nucleotide-binding universal stress UspA family protein